MKLRESTPEEIGRREIDRRVGAVKRSLGSWGDSLREARFSEIGDGEMMRLFERYDALFFDGDLGQALSRTPARLDFGWSKRMTRNAGRTWFRYAQSPVRFSITLSTQLLENSFADVERPIVVNGLLCHDRVDAFLRVFEHELIHLLEYLEWGTSSCRRRRFRRLARATFGHTEFGHRLVTQAERARELYDLGPGDRVSFEIEGRRRVGVVNRITRHATVLVKDRRGRRYSDGRRYSKFYVPLPLLRRLQ